LKEAVFSSLHSFVLTSRHINQSEHSALQPTIIRQFHRHVYIYSYKYHDIFSLIRSYSNVILD